MIKLVLVRHGQSIWNLENKFTGWTDVPLSKKGVEEAIEAGEIIKRNGYTFDVAYTSVLKRAKDTLYNILKVLNEIENCKINYQIIYENSNPIIKDFKKLNNYEVYAEKAKNAIQINENIKILEEKIKKANDAELKKILEYINGLIL